EIFCTAEAAQRHADLLHGANVSIVTDEAIEALAETVRPQGIVAVCRQLDAPRVPERARLIAVLAGIRDPGNAGTVLRTADAAGARAVVFAGDTVAPYNGKAVRSSAASLFHVDIVRERDPRAALRAVRDQGVAVL